MKPDTFKEANIVLGAGGNPNTDQLPVCAAVHNEIAPGRIFLVSRWKLTPEELQLIQERGELWIGIMSTSMAPIMPMVYHPFEEGGYKPFDING